MTHKYIVLAGLSQRYFLIVRRADITQTQLTFSVLYSPILSHAVKNNKTIYLAVMLLLLRTDFTVMP